MFSSYIKKIPNNHIGVFAPSSYVDEARFDAGVTLLQAHGFKVTVHPQSYAKHGQSAGTTEEKLDAFYDLVQDESIGVIMAAAGGNRALHLLEEIDFIEARIKNKVFCGFSDFTAIALGVHSTVNIPSIYGAMVQNLAQLNDADLQHYIKLLKGDIAHIDFSNEATVLKGGTAYGKILGGTLSILPCLTGTKYMPDTDGHILFIEDCHEELSRLDRMLAHLKEAMPFSKLGGLIIGQFTDVTDTGRPFGFTLDDIINEHIDVINGPVIKSAPFGHGERLRAMPIGVLGQLSATESEAKLSF